MLKVSCEITLDLIFKLNWIEKVSLPLYSYRMCDKINPQHRYKYFCIRVRSSIDLRQFTVLEKELCEGVGVDVSVSVLCTCVGGRRLRC